MSGDFWGSQEGCQGPSRPSGRNRGLPLRRRRPRELRAFFSCMAWRAIPLRCTGKAGNPFKTTQGNRLSCRDQEGRRGSEEVVPGPSVFPSREPGVSGKFWGSHEGCQGPFRPSGWNRGLPLRRHRGQGPHLPKRWEPRGVSRAAAGFSSYDGDLRLPLGLALQRKRCRDPRCSPRGNPACRGTFGGRRKAVRDRLALQGGTGDFP